MSGVLKKHEEHKLQLSRIARSQGPNPKDMQAQFMNLVLRVNEINMQWAELRARPPAAYESPSGGIASSTGSWEKSGDTDSFHQGRIPTILLLVLLASLTL